MHSFLQDLRFALRMLRKRPAASAVIVLTLGLGVGANAVFFNAFFAMAMKPLPFSDPERLVALQESQPALGKSWYGVSSPNLADWMAAVDTFAAWGAYVDANFNVHPGDEAVRVEGARVTASLFPTLGVRPALGRLIRPDEDVPGGPRVALLGHELWNRSFAGDPGVVGRTLRIDDEVYEIVGVMPQGFRFFIDGQLWTPLRLDPARDRRDDRALQVIARLAAGAGPEEARTALEAVARRLEELHPETNEGWSAEARRLRDAWLPPVTRLASAAQQALAFFVLLIVCANVVNIVLAQAAARQRESALRAALGAGRGRLLRQAVTESLVLAALGGAVGLLLAAWGEVWLASLSAVTIPYWLDFEMSWPIVAFTALTTLLAGLVIGVFPALRGAGADLFAALKAGGRGEGESGARLRRLLVVAEYSLTVVILVAALLMVRSYAHLRAADPGFDSQGVLTLRLSLTGHHYDAAAARSAFLEETLRRLDALPEVASAGAVDYLPISNAGYRAAALEVEGRTYRHGEEPQTALQAASRGYLETLGIELRRGRPFTAAEAADGADVALVSESLAAELWPGLDPIGRRLRALGGGAERWLEVVGVVEDVRPGQTIAGVDAPPSTQVYVPLAAEAPRLPTLAVKSRETPAAVADAVRREIRRLDPSVPVFQVFTMERVIRRFYFAQDIWSRMFAAIAALALVIAAIGAYGVTAYSVSRRTREMGIRIALGARLRELLGMVIHQGLGLAAVGVGVGLALAIPLARVMASLIHDLSPHDPGVFTLVTAILVGVGIVASFLPAHRAARVDPIVALRDE